MASPHLRLTDYAVCDVTVQRITSDSFGVVYLRPNQLVEGQWHAMKPVRPEVRACSLRARALFFCEALTWVWLWLHADLLAARFVTEINGHPFLTLDCAKDNVATSSSQRWMDHKERSKTVACTGAAESGRP